MPDTEDYLEEATPSAHHESHEDEGTDEMSLAGLALDPADMALDTSDFDGILSGADDNPQKALDTVDDHGHAQLHTQGTDQYLDQGGPRQVTAEECQDAATLMHTQNSDTAIGVGSAYESSHINIADAVTKRHVRVHASQHVTGGNDVVANAVAAGNSGLMTGADKTKLDGIDDLADVTGDNAPKAHAASHKLAGSDLIKLDELAQPADNTNLDFSTSRHGLVPKGTNVGDYLKDDGTWDLPSYPAFGSYVAKAVDTEYQAAEDGMVVGYADSVADGDRVTLNGSEGAVSGSLTLRTASTAQYVAADNVKLGYAPISFPVKKDNYWKVELADYGTTGTGHIWWVPAH